MVSLTVAEVLEIKAHLRDNLLKQQEIAVIYKISASTLNEIKSGKCWSWR